MKLKVIDTDITLASINNKFVGRSFALSKQYRGFKEEIKAYISPVIHDIEFPIDAIYKMTIIVNTYKDIDNFVKPLVDEIFDSIQVNDKCLLELHVTKVPQKRGLTEHLHVLLDWDESSNQ